MGHTYFPSLDKHMEFKVVQLAPVNPPKVYTLTFNEDEIKILMNIHGSLPCTPFVGSQNEHSPRAMGAAYLSEAIFNQLNKLFGHDEYYGVFDKAPEWAKK